MTKLVYNWSTDLVIATNGNELSQTIMDELSNKIYLLLQNLYVHYKVKEVI